jgi:hypothetical protein
VLDATTVDTPADAAKAAVFMIAKKAELHPGDSLKVTGTFDGAQATQNPRETDSDVGIGDRKAARVFLHRSQAGNGLSRRSARSGAPWCAGMGSPLPKHRRRAERASGRLVARGAASFTTFGAVLRGVRGFPRPGIPRDKDLARSRNPIQ